MEKTLAESDEIRTVNTVCQQGFLEKGGIFEKCERENEKREFLVERGIGFGSEMQEVKNRRERKI